MWKVVLLVFKYLNDVHFFVGCCARVLPQNSSWQQEQGKVCSADDVMKINLMKSKQDLHLQENFPRDFLERR